MLTRQILEPPPVLPETLRLSADKDGRQARLRLRLDLVWPVDQRSGE